LIFTYSQNCIELANDIIPKINKRVLSVFFKLMLKTSLKVKVPPGKELTPMQQEMDCDGVDVKIPWLRFKITDQGKSVQEDDENEVEYP
jgi:hypothetical protein